MAEAPRDLAQLTVLGVMSGTSLDGIDTVTARLERVAGRLRWQVLSRGAHLYPPEVAARLKLALDPRTSDVILLTELHQAVGQVYADVVAAEQAKVPVDLVALSGQTVYHIPRPDPEMRWTLKSTLQLGDASVVTERCRVMTVSDFRQSDIAAGGQGAPLVPFSDHLLYSEPGVSRLVVNLGGIANLTYLPADGDPAGVLAFDTGPANCILDDAARAFLGAERDEDGRVAASGSVDAAALARLMYDPYFRLAPPKTTGREVFHLRSTLQRGWGVAPEARAESPLAVADLLSTIMQLSVESLASAIEAHVAERGVDEVLVAGGGARNPELMRRLAARLAWPVKTFAAIGFDDKDRETLAMAVMGFMALNGEPNISMAATGARHPVVAGKICRPYLG
ncbi:MAG: anhydro-N-acetylmuramic acid kinase [Trueperaceae bacterium]|nr:anhydro-N-acetylmuramic acid kinase [Trueperaceae bacterium]